MNYVPAIVVGLVLVFFLFSNTRFQKTRMLSNFPYAPDEQQLFEEHPIQIEQLTKRGAGKKTRRIMNPFVKITNKHIIIAQKKSDKPDGPIYVLLSLTSQSVSALATWWKQGYAVMQVTVSETQAFINQDGTYTIELTLPVQIAIPESMNTTDMRQIMRITTGNLSAYEKALNMKIPVKS